MPNAFSISLHCGVCGRGRANVNKCSCNGYDGNFACNCGLMKTETRVGGLPRSAESFICSGLVAQSRKSIAASGFFASRGMAINQLPISAPPGCRPPGICLNSILPTTFDFDGSLKELIHAGQLIDIAAV